jgi:hypothetical protein
LIGRAAPGPSSGPGSRITLAHLPPPAAYYWSCLLAESAVHLRLDHSPPRTSRFRADHAQYLGDPSFDDLIQALLRASPDFRRWWPRHEVLGSGEGRKTLIHPTVGRLEFEHALFKHGEETDHRLVLYSPLPQHDTPAKLASLLAST